MLRVICFIRSINGCLLEGYVDDFFGFEVFLLEKIGDFCDDGALFIGCCLAFYFTSFEANKAVGHGIALNRGYVFTDYLYEIG